MNDENLIPITKRTKSEQREIQKKGGIASGKKRKEKADLRRMMNTALNLPIKDIKQAGRVKTIDKLKALSEVKSSNVDGATGIVSVIMAGALKGDPQMIKFALQLSGAFERVEETVEEVNDGFLEALNGTAVEDWTNEED